MSNMLFMSFWFSCSFLFFSLSSRIRMSLLSAADCCSFASLLLFSANVRESGFCSESLFIESILLVVVGSVFMADV